MYWLLVQFGILQNVSFLVFKALNGLATHSISGSLCPLGLSDPLHSCFETSPEEDWSLRVTGPSASHGHCTVEDPPLLTSLHVWLVLPTFVLVLKHLWCLPKCFNGLLVKKYLFLIILLIYSFNSSYWFLLFMYLLSYLLIACQVNCIVLLTRQRPRPELTISSVFNGNYWWWCWWPLNNETIKDIGGELPVKCLRPLKSAGIMESGQNYVTWLHHTI